MVNSLKAFQDAIEQGVAAAEDGTSAEFVPVWADRSADYFWSRAAISLILGLFAFPLLDDIFFWKALVVSKIVTALLALSFGIFFFFIFGVFPKLLYFLLPRRYLLEHVSSAAGKAFLDEEVFTTRDRTGILIFASEFEKAVYVLADKGLDDVDAEYWPKLGSAMALHMGKGQDEVFHKVLEELGPLLKQKHPLDKARDLNELHDKLRIRRFKG